jgi:antitoxin (DNA-binding transcriptional repressor) of toxin-antitoxin stability system
LPGDGLDQGGWWFLRFRAASGETIFIGNYGRAEAVLTSAATAKPKKRIGLLEGKLIVPDDFDAPLPPELLVAFEGDTE